MPIRLTVVFLILALIVPVAVGFIGDFRKDTEVSDLLIQAKTVSNTAKKTYYAGIGGVFTADVSIGTGCRLDIGGEGSDAYEIRMVYSDEEVGRVFMERPPVRFAEPVSVSGILTLEFECVSCDGGAAVRVSVL